MAHNANNQQWPSAQNVAITLTYPASGVGLQVTYVAIQVTQVRLLKYLFCNITFLFNLYRPLILDKHTSSAVDYISAPYRLLLRHIIPCILTTTLSFMEFKHVLCFIGIVILSVKKNLQLNTEIRKTHIFIYFL